MKAVKRIKKFIKEYGSCYIYIEGSGNFYSAGFVIPILESKEDVIIHNGCGDRKGFKIYETISNKEYRKRLTLMIKDISCTTRLGNITDNFVHSPKSNFDNLNAVLWNIKRI